MCSSDLTTASTGAFTTLSASSTVSGTGFSTYLASPPAIGGTAASTGAFTTLSASGVTSITNATASTAAGNGALVVTGGIGVGGNSVFGGNVNIVGNLTVTGNTVSIGASTLSINDPIINLNTPSDLTPLTTATTADIGLKFHYYDTADSAAFVGRAADTGYLEWYGKGTDTANVFTGTVYGTIKTGALWLANTTAATGTTSGTAGALYVAGGAGIAGALYNGGVHISSGNIVAASGTASTNTTTGALVVAGGAGISGAVYAGSIQNTPIGSTTASTGAFTTGTFSSTLGVTGATTLTTATTGGLQAVAIGNVTPGTGAFTTLTNNGATTHTSNTQSTSTSTGAVVITGGTAITTGNLYIGGSAGTAITHTGHILPSANLTYNLGSTTAWYNIFYGVSTQAKYADLAENYQADKPYMAGQVVMFGGEKEVTLADADTTRVAGVVSTNPAHLMNGGLTGNNVVPLALQGRVPCLVIGPVAKGDIMVSAGFGYAKTNNSPLPGQTIGKALENFNTQGKGLIEVVVGRI